MSYALEDPEGRGKTVRRMLAERAEEEFAISPLVVLECLAGVIKAGDGRGGDCMSSTCRHSQCCPSVQKSAPRRPNCALASRSRPLMLCIWRLR